MAVTLAASSSQSLRFFVKGIVTIPTIPGWHFINCEHILVIMTESSHNAHHLYYSNKMQQKYIFWGGGGERSTKGNCSGSSKDE